MFAALPARPEPPCNNAAAVRGRDGDHREHGGSHRHLHTHRKHPVRSDRRTGTGSARHKAARGGGRSFRTCALVSSSHGVEDGKTAAIHQLSVRGGGFGERSGDDRQPGGPDAPANTAPIHPCCRMRVTLVDGRQVVGRCAIMHSSPPPAACSRLRALWGMVAAL